MRALGVAALVCVLSVASACSNSGTDSRGGAGGSGAAVTGGAGGVVASGGGAPSPIGAGTLQLVSVVSAEWSSTPATLRRYDRAGASGGWTAVGDPISVVLGKNGLAWGRGLHPAPDDGGPIKHEGDGCSPAGIFELGSAFGYAAPDSATWLELPYLQATDDLECVDDPTSSHYNQLVYRSTVAVVDWSSSELMHRPDNLYAWGVFVDHNTLPTQSGAGSCIFLHLWSGPSSATVGCTAGDETQMKTVFGWLAPGKHPVIVQLPQAAYEAHRAVWALP